MAIERPDRFYSQVQRRAPIQRQTRKGPSAEERRIDMLIQAGLGLLGTTAETALRVGSQEGGWAQKLLTPEETLREQAAKRRLERGQLQAATQASRAATQKSQMDTALAPSKAAADIYHKTTLQDKLEAGRNRRQLASETGQNFRAFYNAKERRKLARLNARLRRRGQSATSKKGFIYKDGEYYNISDLNSQLKLMSHGAGRPGGSYLPTARKNRQKIENLLMLQGTDAHFKRKRDMLDSYPEAKQSGAFLSEIPENEMSVTDKAPKPAVQERVNAINAKRKKNNDSVKIWKERNKQIEKEAIQTLDRKDLIRKGVQDQAVMTIVAENPEYNKNKERITAVLSENAQALGRGVHDQAGRRKGCHG